MKAVMNMKFINEDRHAKI